MRLDAFGLELISYLAKIVELDDAGITAALRLRKPETSPRALLREREQLAKKITDTKNARHVLIADRAAARISQRDYEAEVFAFRNDLAAFEQRVAAIDRELAESQSKPSFEPARSAVRWLAENWADLSIAGRAEAIRLLVTRVTVTPTGRPKILEWGPAFRRQKVEPKAGRAKVV